MKDVVIYGAGSVGRLAEQIIYDINQDKHQFSLVGFIDDNEAFHGRNLNGIPVLGGMTWLERNPNMQVVLGFSNPQQKNKLVGHLKKVLGNVSFATLIHPKTWISNRVMIGQGTVVYPGVHLDVDISIGSFCHVNKLVTIGHDSIIGDFSTISPGVNLGGFNEVGSGVDFGINSCTLQKITVGSWSVIGAGAVIIRDVPDNAVVVGNPGRIIRQNQNPVI